MFSIQNDRVTDAAPVALTDPGNPQLPTRIVLHYSAGSTLSGAIQTLRARGLSYHVLIDSDGSLHQTRPFTRTARHAGRSNWKAASGLTNGASLNSASIGISLINLGGFGWFRNGHWYWGRPGPGVPSVPDAVATKRASIYRPGRPMHWTPYAPAQVAAARALVGALVASYPSLTDIVGHDDIAIGDKPDPGPLLPVADWRRAFGREGGLGPETRVASPDGRLNLRDLPSSDGTRIGTLRTGDRLHIRAVAYASPSDGIVPGGSSRALSHWASVDIDGSGRHAGFVHMRYLTRTPLSPDYERVLRA